MTVSATASSGFGAPADVTLTIADDDTLGLDVVEDRGGNHGGGRRRADGRVHGAAGDGAGGDRDRRRSAAATRSEATASPPRLGFGLAADNSDPADPVFLWSAAQTVTVTGVDEDDPDGLQRYAITLDPSSAGDSDYDGLDSVEVSGTNADDDAPTVTLSVAAAGGRLAEGGSAAVTARLDRAIEVATTVEVSAAPGPGASAADFRLSENRTLTVAAGVAEQHGRGDQSPRWTTTWTARRPGR